MTHSYRRFCLALLLMVAPGPLVPAATLHFDNFNFALDGTELLLVDNAGNPLITGFVALYQFGNPASAPSDFASLRSNGGGGLLNLVEISAANSSGGIGVLVTPLSAFNSNGELRDLQLYAVVGNGGSVAVSTQFGHAEYTHRLQHIGRPRGSAGLLFCQCDRHCGGPNGTTNCQWRSGSRGVGRPHAGSRAGAHQHSSLSGECLHPAETAKVGPRWGIQQFSPVPSRAASRC